MTEHTLICAMAATIAGDGVTSAADAVRLALAIEAEATRQLRQSHRAAAAQRDAHAVLDPRD